MRSAALGWQRSGFATKVSASMVKELRESSGAPMMDCKKALTESEGDMQKAVDWLRAKGIAKASKSAAREASEGLIGLRAVTTNSASGEDGLVLVEVNSETDFVGRNEDFHKFVKEVTDNILQKHGSDELRFTDEGRSADVEAILQADGGAMQNKLTDAINVIRENIVLKRVEFIPGAGGELLSHYVHGKVYSDDHGLVLGSQASVVSLQCEGENDGTNMEGVGEVGRKLAMHVVAASPLYATKADVPSDFLQREKEVLKEQMEEAGQAEGKKPEMVDKILDGKLNKRLAEICLANQSHFAEEGAPVIEKHLKSSAAGLGLKKLSLGKFWRWTLGGSA